MEARLPAEIPGRVAIPAPAPLRAFESRGGERNYPRACLHVRVKNWHSTDASSSCTCDLLVTITKAETAPATSAPSCGLPSDSGSWPKEGHLSLEPTQGLTQSLSQRLQQLEAATRIIMTHHDFLTPHSGQCVHDEQRRQSRGGMATPIAWYTAGGLTLAYQTISAKEVLTAAV